MMLGTPSLPSWFEPWRERAACAKADPDLFFDPRRSSEAVAVCEPCPVRVKCLDDALTYSNTADQWGVFGGATPAERKQIRKQRGTEAA